MGKVFFFLNPYSKKRFTAFIELFGGEIYYAKRKGT